MTDVGQLHAPIMREKREPRDGFEPVPLMLVATFGAVLFWGGWYLATFSGGWQPDVLNPDPEARFASRVPLEKLPLDPLALGERLYRANCVSCHQVSGLGVAGQYPSLVGSEWVLENDHQLKRILLQGIEGPMTVLGQTYSGNMPGFGGRLNDEQIAAVLTYIRQSWGNDAELITAEAVAATRAATQHRSQPWTEPELLAITEPDWITTIADDADQSVDDADDSQGNSGDRSSEANEAVEAEPE